MVSQPHLPLWEMATHPSRPPERSVIIGVTAALLSITPVVAVADSAQTREPSPQTCVEVEIVGERTPDYGCLTKALNRRLRSVTPVPNVPPIGTQPSPNQVGLITPTELRQQYGPNYGKSAQPYRPQRTYPIPLINGSR